VLADDLGYADVGFNGATFVRTPNLDRLAKSGAQLGALYVQPVCTPTRAALLTGRYPIRYGLQMNVVSPWGKAGLGLPLEERTLAEALRDAGYQTALVGKWHLGHFRPEDLPTHRGFDHQYGSYNDAINHFTHHRNGVDWHRDDRLADGPEDAGYSTELLTREAVRRIRERDRARPLFLYVAYDAVHFPLQAPDEYLRRYASLREPRRTYAAMIAALDDGVGAIAKALDDEGMRANTLLVFSSDNGGVDPGVVADNGPLRAGKFTLYEGGVRAAAFASWEGHVPAGTRVDAPLHVVDWFPTLVRLAGGVAVGNLPLDGRDAWPTITAGQPSPHDVILVNATPPAATLQAEEVGALRLGDWKIVLPRAAGGDPHGDELYDLAHDAGERFDLAAKYPAKARELRARYDALAVQAVPPLLEDGTFHDPPP
jgi:arylsulfatase A-like enzyme